MKILILSSSSLHFPLDIQATLKEAGLEAHRLQSLNEFISSPLRKEPFLAILEVGSTEDIDRALVAYEWAETVQPLAAARYLLLVGSKHISLKEKSSRFRGVEIAQLPLPVKNLMFKVELQLKVLSSESKSKSEKKIDGFSAEIREVDRERVMVIRGMGPKEGGWKNSGDTPQGRIRWRWIDDPPKQGRPEEKFSWSAESKTAPVFNAEIDGWEVKDPEADLQCHRGGKEIFSAKKAGQGGAGTEEKPAAGSTSSPKASSASPASTAAANPAAATLAATAGPSAKNSLVTASEKAAAPGPQPTPAASPAPQSTAPAASHFSGEKHSGVNPLPAQQTATPVAAKQEKPESPASVAEKAAAPATTTAPSAAREAKEKPASPAADIPKLGQTKQAATSSLPSLEKESKSRAPSSGENAAPSAPEKKAQEPAPAAPNPQANTEKQTTAASNPGTPEASRPQGTPSLSLNEGRPEKSPSQPALSSKESTKREVETPAAADPSRPQAPSGKEGLPAASLKSNATEKSAAAPAPQFAAPGPAKKESPSTTAAQEPAREKAASAPEHLHSRKLRTEVIQTHQHRPAESGGDSTTEFPEKTREITGKVVIPKGPAQSDHQNLLRSSGSQEPTEKSLISSAERKADEAQHLKTRLFLTLSLEELQDQNSSWIPVEGYRIYLSARHRYYGLRDLADIFPLWIYEGELAPEFLDLQKAWKFYDRLPKSYQSIETLPAPVARYLIEMSGAAAEKQKDQPEDQGADGGEAGEAKSATSAKYISGAKGGGEDTSRPSVGARPALFSPAWFAEFLKSLLGR